MAEGYRLLGTALSYPKPERLRAELAGAPPELSAIAKPLLETIDDAIAGEHLRLFAQSAPVSPYEGAYVARDKGALLGQLAALYELFGAHSGGSEHEPPDHAGAEIEFVALLALKQAMALHRGELENAEITARARRVFVEEHLGRWLPELCRRLESASFHPFFQTLARTLAAWIARDIAASGFEVIPLALRRTLPVAEATEAEDLTCPVS